MKSVILLQILFISALPTKANLGCRDENGKLVDWFYLYKIPQAASFSSIKDKFSSNSGLNYLYITSDSTTAEWTLSEKLINSSTSFPGYTLSQSIFGQNKDNLVVMYNDQPPPDGIGIWSKGHSKGLVVTNSSKGFWLVHSVPRFPLSFENGSVYNYPNTGRMYGQSFLCISFDADQMDKVGRQLVFNEVEVYASQVPVALQGKFPVLESSILMKAIAKAPFNNTEVLKSTGGREFTSFAKAKLYNKELYQDYVSATLNDDFIVESWMQGNGSLPSNCTQPNKVYNAESIKIQNYGLNFTILQDHSKWGVSLTDAKNWICVGDINRQITQARRGGGTVCQQSQIVSSLYRKSVQAMAACLNK